MMAQTAWLFRGRLSILPRAIVNDRQIIDMSYTMGTTQERMAPFAAVTLLHAGLATALLTISGYEAIRSVIKSSRIKVLPPDTLPPEPAPWIADTVIDDIKVNIPEVIILAKKSDMMQDRVTMTSVPPAPEPPEKEPVRYAANVDPRYVHMILLNYPGIARSMGTEAMVDVLVTVGEDSHVKTVSLAKSSGYDVLDTANLRHAQKTLALQAGNTRW